MQRFLRMLVAVDHDNLLYTLVWNKFSGPIRALLDNKFVFEPFWHFQSGRIGEREWQEK